MANENATKPDGGQDPLLTDVTFPPIGEEEAPTSEETDVEARIRQMEERFEANQAAFQEERARWQQTVDKLITQQAPRQEQTPPTPQAQPIDFSDLPDPVDKPEEFKKAMAQRFEQEMNQRMSQQFEQYQHRQTAQQTVSQQLDDVWTRFQGQHPDLAAKTITLQGAVLAERNAMQQRGIDPQRGILADPDGFMNNVAKRMRDELGMAAPEPTSQHQQPGSTPGAGQQQQQQQPANRTAGVGGASRVNGGGQGSGKGSPSFIDQLKKTQLDSGLI